MTDPKTRLKYEVFPVQPAPDDGEYRVEAIESSGRGEVFVATFSGPGAKARAVDYFASVWKMHDLLWSSLCEVTPTLADHGFQRKNGVTPRAMAARGDPPTVLYGSMNGSPL